MEATMKRIPSNYQSAIYQWIGMGRGDAVVNAVAGSGKTTTLVDAANLIRSSRGLFLAFNKAIVNELQSRIPGLKVQTLHSLGFGILARNSLRKITTDASKFRTIAEQAAGYVRMGMLRSKPAGEVPHQDTIEAEMYHLLRLGRLTLTPLDNLEAVAGMVDRYSMDIDEDRLEVYVGGGALAEMLDQGVELFRERGIIDFEDMLFLPLHLNFSAPQYDWIMVDECQDLSAAQLELALRLRAPGGRYLFVGDRRQAIYGFAGAQTDSVDQIILRTGAAELPLSICYRCPVTHLDLARSIVPQLEARPDAPAGVVETVVEEKLPEVIREGDMVLCRTTAPLVRMCMKMIACRIPARVRGRDLGKGLAKTIREVSELPGFKYPRFPEFVRGWFAIRSGKALGKARRPEQAERAIQDLQDRADTVVALWENCDRAKNAEALTREIDTIFSDDRASVILSTVHRAKGLEAERVFILAPEKLPLRWKGQTESQAVQEVNLRYVALTRSRSYLAFVVDVKPTPEPAPLLTAETSASA